MANVDRSQRRDASRGGPSPASRTGRAPALRHAPAPAFAPSIAPVREYEPPIEALAPLFRNRLQKIHVCRAAFDIDISVRPTRRVLGKYYRSRCLVRIYTHDARLGRRPLKELFDTFLHEVAHHLEYTEPRSFGAKRCQRVPGRMHSRLFWRILGDLKQGWFDVRERHWAALQQAEAADGR